MTWMNQILTGANNQTLAIGRVLGSVLFVQLLVIFPGIELVTVVQGTLTINVWSGIYGGLATYVPAIILAIGGLIAGTHFTEPRTSRFVGPGEGQLPVEQEGGHDAK